MIYVQRALSDIMTYGTFEDRLEYDKADLVKAYNLTLGEGEVLFSALRVIQAKPWRWSQLNKKFLKSLFGKFRYTGFTTQQADQVYHEKHWRSWHGYDRQEALKHCLDNWGQMSARNALTNAVLLGILKRESKGFYRFERL